MQEAIMTEPTDDLAPKLVSTFIKIRSKREELSKEYEGKDQELKEQQDLIKREMLELCKYIGADSIRTPAGTITRTVKKRYFTSDWESLYEFIKEHDCPDIFEKRIHQGNLIKLTEDDPNLLPKGVSLNSEYAVTIRRSR